MHVPNANEDRDVIRWRLHLRSSPNAVFAMLDTDEGRARWWAESAIETSGVIHFTFPNGFEWYGRILERRPPHLLCIEYIGGSRTTFELSEEREGGTELRMTDVGVDPAERAEVIAGWVSVLLALKAAVDFDVDLRNHDPHRTWDHGFAEN